MLESHGQEKRKLWRYMPLIALLDFLQTGELRLSRADSFDDRREGLIGLDAMSETIPSELHAHARSALAAQNKECFISCWHLSSFESLAMWKVYGVQSFAVAVVTHAGRVMRACSDFCADLSSSGMAGEVVYDNYVTNGIANVKTVGLPFGYKKLPVPLSIMTLFMKARAFSYEQEWRLVLVKKNHDHLGLRVGVGDLNHFIEAIYVAPEAPDWMVRSIQTLIAKQFDLSNISVSRSPLSEHFGG